MNTYPSKEQYREWSNKYSRVPILGEKCILKFNAPYLFSKLFSKNSEAFLFESGKGSSDISRYSYMGESNQSYVEIREKYSTIKLNNTSKKLTGTVDDGWDVLNFKKNIPCFKYLPHFSVLLLMGLLILGLYFKFYNVPFKKKGRINCQEKKKNSVNLINPSYYFLNHVIIRN